MTESNLPVSTALRRLWQHLGRHRRVQLLLLIGLAFAMSFAELATIGTVVPFMAALLAPERLFANPLAGPFIRFLSITEPSGLLLPLSVAFGSLGILAAVVRVTQLYANTRFAFAVAAELSTSVYRRVLYQPYAIHVSRNSSEIINAIITQTTLVVNNVILAFVLMCGGAIVMLSVVAGLLVVDVFTTLIAFGGFGIIYAGILFGARRYLYRSSVRIALESTVTLKALQEGLGGIRDVLIGQSQEIYAEAFRKSEYRLRIAQAFNQFVGQAPRYIIEGLAMCAVATTAYLLSFQPGGVASALPVLAALALGAQRLLPVMQQIYNSISSMRGHEVPLSNMVLLLDQPVSEGLTRHESAVDKIPFERSIELRNVSFNYGASPGLVLNGLSLRVRKGQKVGIIGATGSGKSTLIDILMGLLTPVTGQLLVDGQPVQSTNLRGWQAHLSHVPQSIFLVDGTVAENIALTAPGQPVNWDRIRRCASMAHISTTIEEMPDGYQTRVGERGVMLSGGQRQRIGIARALYKEADLIVLDEATSALDTSTEEDVMQSIQGLDAALTIFMVAHRLSSLKSCDLVVELAQGKILRSGSFEEIVGPNY